MRKYIYITIVILVIFLTNTITYNTSKSKIIYEVSQSFSDCYINSNIYDDVSLESDSNNLGHFIKISNNSKCFNIEDISLKIISINGLKNDTINLNINERIKSNYDANIKLNDLKIDSIISSSFIINKISIISK